MIKVEELYRRDGVWNGRQIVPAAWIHECTSASTFQTRFGGPSDDDYGLLWWVIAKPAQAGYYALGFGGQLIVVRPEPGAVIVYLTDVPSDPASQLDGSGFEALNNVFISAFA